MRISLDSVCKRSYFYILIVSIALSCAKDEELDEAIEDENLEEEVENAVEDVEENASEEFENEAEEYVEDVEDEIDSAEEQIEDVTGEVEGYNDDQTTAQDLPGQIPGADTAASGGSAGPVAMPDGTVLRYVMSSRVNVRSGPGTSNAVVSSRIKGDRVLVTYEGDWARLGDGTYLTASALTDKATGHERSANRWRSQR